MTPPAVPTHRVAGAERIRQAFATARDAGRVALVPYIVAGRPSVDDMPDLVADLVDAGADLVELGIPFSDPLADGSVIRNATRLALDDGMSVAGVLDVVRDIRSNGIDVPLVGMGYVNPLLAYGIEAFCSDAAAAGLDGLIVPDVPLESATQLREAAAQHGLGLTFLATPLTSSDRIAALAAASTGFLYAVATTGTTGARSEVADTIVGQLARCRAHAGDVPVAVGFGVATGAHVTLLAPHADGVIVGSALVELLEQDPAAALARVRELASATVR